MKRVWIFYREAAKKKTIRMSICLLSSGFCALHICFSCHFIPGMAEMALIAQSQLHDLERTLGGLLTYSAGFVS